MCPCFLASGVYRQQEEEAERKRNREQRRLHIYTPFGRRLFHAFFDNLHPHQTRFQENLRRLEMTLISVRQPDTKQRGYVRAFCMAVTLADVSRPCFCCYYLLTSTCCVGLLVRRSAELALFAVCSIHAGRDGCACLGSAFSPVAMREDRVRRRTRGGSRSAFRSSMRASACSAWSTEAHTSPAG